MAVSTVETIIANPARKRRRNMARSFKSLKQKLHFGSKAQRTAAAASLKRSRAAKRAASHRKRNVPKRHNAGMFSRRKTKKRFKAFLKKRGIVGYPMSRVTSLRKKPKARKRRHNPGEIIALTSMNPAKRRSMARTRRRHHKRASSHRAGHRRTKRNPAHRMHHRRRHNPGQVTSMVRSAVAAGVGFVGSKVATQAVLGANNTGFQGYLGNAVATGILSFGTHMFTKNKMDAFMVGVGGVLNILGRIIADNSLLGQYSAQLGMGDYLVANWWIPQRLDGPPFSLTTQGYDMSWMPQPTIPMASAAAPGMGYLPAPIPNLYGNDLY